MAEPRPIRTLLLLESAGLVAMAFWWATRTPALRFQHLMAVMDTEHVAAMPPTSLLEQVTWLTHHRWTALQSLAVVASVALLIGVTEGMVRRSRDIYGGFRLSWFTAGTVSMGVLVGLCGAYLVVPWPLRLTWVGSGLSALVMVMGYGLGFGRPYAK